MKKHSRSLALAVLFAGTFTAPAIAQNAGAGATAFKTRCQVCHQVVAGKPGTIGPNLFGVAGRKVGSTAFNYSPALKASGLTWTPDKLDAFLTAPSKLVPGTRMPISTPDAQSRKDLVAYLKTLK